MGTRKSLNGWKNIWHEEKKRTARRAPGDNVLPDQFQMVTAVLASDWCQKICAHESEKALWVPVSTKGITVDHEHGNWIEQHSKQCGYLIEWLYSQLLRYNQSANGKEPGKKAVFAVKDTIKTVTVNAWDKQRSTWNVYSHDCTKSYNQSVFNMQ